jgi:hypothetical protein
MQFNKRPANGEQTRRRRHSSLKGGDGEHEAAISVDTAILRPCWSPYPRSCRALRGSLWSPVAQGILTKCTSGWYTSGWYLYNTQVILMWYPSNTYMILRRSSCKLERSNYVENLFGLLVLLMPPPRETAVFQCAPRRALAAPATWLFISLILALVYFHTTVLADSCPRVLHNSSARGGINIVVGCAHARREKSVADGELKR